MKRPGDCDGFAGLDGKQIIGLFEWYIKDCVIEIVVSLNSKLIGTESSRDFRVYCISFGIEK